MTWCPACGRGVLWTSPALPFGTRPATTTCLSCGYQATPARIVLTDTTAALRGPRGEVSDG